MTALENAVAQAIATVDDPCSIAARAPLNVFELGLVRSWDVDEDGDVHVLVSPTNPMCVLIGSITQSIQRRIESVPGVRTVVVDIDGDFLWTHDEMTPEGRAKLEQRRQGSMSQVPVAPRQWEGAGNPK